MVTQLRVTEVQEARPLTSKVPVALLVVVYIVTRRQHGDLTGPV